MCHCAAACVNSDATLAPLRNRQCPPGASSGAARARSFDSGATARAVTSGAGARPADFDAGCMDADGGSGDAGSLAQESGFALVRLDQIERTAGGEGQDQAREAGAGAQVDGAGWERLHQRNELERIGNVALPEEWLIPRGDEVDGSVPAEQERRELFERLQCFT